MPWLAKLTFVIIVQWSFDFTLFSFIAKNYHFFSACFQGTILSAKNSPLCWKGWIEDQWQMLETSQNMCQGSKIIFTHNPTTQEDTDTMKKKRQKRQIHWGERCKEDSEERDAQNTDTVKRRMQKRQIQWREGYRGDIYSEEKDAEETDTVKRRMQKRQIQWREGCRRDRYSEEKDAEETDTVKRRMQKRQIQWREGCRRDRYSEEKDAEETNTVKIYTMRIRKMQRGEGCRRKYTVKTSPVRRIWRRQLKRKRGICKELKLLYQF